MSGSYFGGDLGCGGVNGIAVVAVVAVSVAVPFRAFSNLVFVSLVACLVLDCLTTRRVFGGIVA